MTDQIVYQLKSPISAGPDCAMITALFIHEPTAGDLIDAEATPDLAGVALLLARMTGLDLATIRQLGKNDFEAAFLACGPLLNDQMKKRSRR